jgi:hypothetical protein
MREIKEVCEEVMEDIRFRMKLHRDKEDLKMKICSLIDKNHDDLCESVSLFKKKRERSDLRK